jgi:internalin A
MQVDLEVKDGVVTTLPGQLPDAVRLAQEKHLRGISIRDDFPPPGGPAPTCDLAELRHVPWLDTVAISPGLELARVQNFDAVYELRDLRSLSVHEYTRLDLARTPNLESLFVKDGPGLTGIEDLPHLQRLQAWGWRQADLSNLRLPRLTSLTLIQAPIPTLQGLSHLLALKTLELRLCRSIVSIAALPPALQTLRVDSCPRFEDFSFLAGNATVEFVFMSRVRSLKFVPSMRALTRIGFGQVTGGDLGPLLQSPTLREAFFAPRKTYKPSHDEIQRALAQRIASA